MEHKESSSYSAHSSNYSEDFEEDGSSRGVGTSETVLAHVEVTPKRAKPKPMQVARTEPTQRKDKKQFNSTALEVSNRIKGKGGMVLSERKKRKKAPHQGMLFSPRDRELSSKQHAIKILNNKLSECQREVAEIQKENKLLNQLQIRQERELSRVQTNHGELPQILTRHTEELRVMKEQLKRSQESNSSYQNKVHNLQSDIQRLLDRKNKLEQVVKHKHLLERESLTIQLQEANDELRNKDTKIKELEKGKEALKKAHGQEVKTLIHKNKVLIQEAESAKTRAHKTKTKLKERNKEMDVINIYSQRFSKCIPHIFTHQQAAPIMENKKSQTDISCAPNKIVSMQTKQSLKSSSSQTLVEPGKTFKISTTQTDINYDLARPSPTSDIARLFPNTNVAKPSPNTDVAKPSPQKETALVYEASSSPQNIFQSTPGHQAVLTQPKLENISEHVKPVQVPKTEEQQKKDILLAKLRALDSQKVPPASQPITSITAKSSVEGTTTGMTITTQQAKPKPPPQVRPVQDEEAQKKKLLVAKLLAIDDGNDPKKVTVNKMDVTEPAASQTMSNTSLQSRPDTVDNMHKGKPAFASEDDPFGSRNTSGKRLGGRLYSKNDEKTVKSTTGYSEQSPGQLKTVAMNSEGIIPKPDQNFKPTFGRRSLAAETNMDHSKPLLNSTENSLITKKRDGNPGDQGEASKKDYPWENSVNLESLADNHRQLPDRNTSLFGEQGRNSMVFGPRSSKSSLLPFRAKAEMNVIPGGVAEPDDLEELTL